WTCGGWRCLLRLLRRRCARQAAGEARRSRLVIWRRLWSYWLPFWWGIAGNAPPVLLQRLTEFVGTEQSPAVSPDGKSVALSAGQGTPHIWVRLLAGGPPLKITRDEVPHLYPRWAPDSATLIYFSPAAESEVEGAIYEIPALGGTARRLASSFTGADISHDGKRLAFFHRSAGHVELIVADRNGNNPRVLASLASDYGYCCPRWSPDDRLIGYQRGRVFNYDVFAV